MEGKGRSGRGGVGCVGAGARGAVRQSFFDQENLPSEKGSARMCYRVTLDVTIATTGEWIPLTCSPSWSRRPWMPITRSSA